MSGEYKIKPLDWQKVDSSIYEERFEAQTIMAGVISVCKVGSTETDANRAYIAFSRHGMDREDLGDFPTPEAAKQACNEYHEKLIKETLSKFVEVL